TEVPPTEIPPTEPPPTEVPPTEVPPTDEPTVPPTETPVPTETATAEPTSTVTATPSVTPTATPSPAVAWSLGAGPSCTTDEDAVESGGSVVYTCTLAGTVVASAAPDLALDLAWGITTDESSGDWTIAVRPSAQDAWADAGTGTPLSIVDAFVTGSDTSAQTLARTLSFQLRLTRAACVTDDPPVHILVTADLTAPDAPAVPVSAQGTTTANAVVTPVLAAIPEPSIAFLGPLAFGQVSLPSTDQVVVLGGSTTLQVDGLDRSCGVWTIAIESGSLATSDGRDLDAANLLLVSVNGQLAPTSPCGLDEPCLVAVIVAGPTSVPSIQLSLGFQVIVPADAPLGVLNAPVTATIFQETASP
ncbi:MAG TPA: hypothetical protein VNP95_00055, partial [Thermomicrobiales bacterium]|nr:hypothetical protein [Thermomicrobiales bacterium]